MGRCQKNEPKKWSLVLPWAPFKQTEKETPGKQARPSNTAMLPAVPCLWINLYIISWSPLKQVCLGWGDAYSRKDREPYSMRFVMRRAIKMSTCTNQGAYLLAHVPSGKKRMWLVKPLTGCVCVCGVLSMTFSGRREEPRGKPTIGAPEAPFAAFGGTVALALEQMPVRAKRATAQPGERSWGVRPKRLTCSVGKPYILHLSHMSPCKSHFSHDGGVEWEGG